MDCVLAEQNLSNANSRPSDFYQPVSLTMESALTVHFLLYGDFTTEVDYSVWSVDHEHMSTHFVVVKAIQENEGYAGLCQCLGYMGELSQVKPSFQHQGPNGNSLGTLDPQKGATKRHCLWMLFRWI